MIIAAAISENHTRSAISEHFGRCAWYGIYDTASKTNLYIANPGHYLNQNAGVLSAELLLEYAVSMVIAGRFGARVVDVFKTNNVQMIIPQNNQVWNDFIKLIRKNKLKL